jgi:hypothetical protein
MSSLKKFAAIDYDMYAFHRKISLESRGLLGNDRIPQPREETE